MGWFGDAWDWTKEAAGDVWNGLTGADQEKMNNPVVGLDESAYDYGGSPGAAGEARNRAYDVGYGAQSSGLEAGRQGKKMRDEGGYLLEMGKDNANDYDARGAGQAQAFGGRTTGQAYMQQLAGLEAQEGPSAAQAQLQAGTNQAMQSQLALARSGRGFGGNSAAMGLAQGNMAGIQANQANSSAALRAQENAAWRQRQAGNLTSATQGMLASQGQNDQAMLSAQAQADQAAAQARAQGQQAWQQGNQGYFQGQGATQQGYQTSLGAQGLGNQIQSTQMGGQMAAEQAKLDRWGAEHGYEMSKQNAEDQRRGAWLSMAGSVMGAAATASDIRMKTKVAPADSAFLPVGADGLTDERRQHYAEQERAARGTSAPPMSTDLARWSRGGFPADDEYRPEPARRVTAGGQQVDLKQPDLAALDAARSAPGYRYEYKNPQDVGAAPGEHFGPMAQDLAKTPAGASTVTEMPNGKMGVDTGRLALVNTGAINAQQKQLDQMAADLDALNGRTEKDDFAPSFRTDYGFGGRR